MIRSFGEFGQKIYCSHVIALQERTKVVTEGIITNSDWLQSKLIAFLANQNRRKYQNKLKESDFWESCLEVLIGLNFDSTNWGWSQL